MHEEQARLCHTLGTTHRQSYLPQTCANTHCRQRNAGCAHQSTRGWVLSLFTTAAVILPTKRATHMDTEQQSPQRLLFASLRAQYGGTQR